MVGHLAVAGAQGPAKTTGWTWMARAEMGEMPTAVSSRFEARLMLSGARTRAWMSTQNRSVIPI